VLEEWGNVLHNVKREGNCPRGELSGAICGGEMSADPQQSPQSELHLLSSWLQAAATAADTDLVLRHQSPLVDKKAERSEHVVISAMVPLTLQGAKATIMPHRII